jgi:hypothetical protein
MQRYQSFQHLQDLSSGAIVARYGYLLPYIDTIDYQQLNNMPSDQLTLLEEMLWESLCNTLSRKFLRDSIDDDLVIASEIE